ncbi:MAG TPA: 5-carboxymethyl-2-hydroxymuconate Delta-isomerase [Burkholderiaceae bacterium]|nr:5-carboxymethyl-2-hydroxymuconate Delta-isomerase [Burkholderiaceae bacterium]
MPHVTLQYTANLETEVDIPGLCQALAQTLVALKDEAGGALFPIGGTRVLAYPSVHYAVADGKDDYGFCYINVRIAPGRSDAMKKKAGDALLAQVQAHFAAVFEKRHVGVTLQIDESPGQVYDAKHSNLHPLFKK